MRKTILFCGRKILATTTHGYFEGVPYIVMRTSEYGITVMMRRNNKWTVETACVKLEDEIIRKRIHERQNYEGMMKHERAKKSSGMRKSGCSESMKYKQVTVYAYWENLYNSKSGNASVVCANMLIG